jgi:hypothetical protein
MWAGGRRSEGEPRANHAGQALRDVVSLIGGGGLDHHPHQRLGAGLAQQDATGVAQSGGLGGHGRLEFLVRVDAGGVDAL